MRIPWMNSASARFPMKITWAKKSSQGQNFHFQAWNYHFHVWTYHFHAWKFHISMRENEIFIMKFSCLDFLLYETFRTSISTERNNLCHWTTLTTVTTTSSGVARYQFVAKGWWRQSSSGQLGLHGKGSVHPCDRWHIISIVFMHCWEKEEYSICYESWQDRRCVLEKCGSIIIWSPWFQIYM